MKYSPVWLCQERKCRFKDLKWENKKLRQKLNNDRSENLQEKVDNLTAQIKTLTESINNMAKYQNITANEVREIARNEIYEVREKEKKKKE